MGLRDGRIEQPRLADVPTKRAALMPISDDQAACVARRVSELFRRQHDAIVMEGFQREFHGDETGRSPVVSVSRKSAIAAPISFSPRSAR